MLGSLLMFDRGGNSLYIDMVGLSVQRSGEAFGSLHGLLTKETSDFDRVRPVVQAVSFRCNLLVLEQGRAS